jgi:hypothetical protein
MFDVFYFNKKPGLFPHEQQAESLQHAQALSRTRYFWIVNYLLDYSNFDFVYEPRPWQAQFTHVWPSQHQKFSGTFLVPKQGAVDNYHFESQVIPSREQEFQVLYPAEFDTTWHPHPMDPPFIYVFGNQWHSAEIMPTVEYHVSGATERKYMTEPRAQLPERHCNRWHTLVDCEWDYSWVPDPGDPPFIYVFGNQHWSAEKMPTLEYHSPGATERKYMRYPYAQLLPDATNWTVPPDITPDDVDYTWVPDPGEPPYIYQFATQHQKTGGPVYTVPGATEVKYLDQMRLRTISKATAVYEIDHLDGNAGQVPNSAKTVRYFDNYRDTLIRLAKSIGSDHEWVWVCSSICDYSDFDFSWHPEQWQGTMLHVFPSNDQKFGDTFFMHVPTFAERAEKKALLEWYDVNFVDRIVPRRPLPVIEHSGDSNVEAVKTAEWQGPLALFTTNGLPITVPAVNLWRSETKTITPLSAGASAVIVPRVAVPHIKTQLYDYPYIDKKQQRRHGDTNLDIVFISNGELNAEINYAALLDSRYNRNNLMHRVDNVKGRVAAYHAAARASTTPWFFAVFAKLRVEPNFNWDWQPDRMQQPKHYIFHAENTVNGLIYGHQAMIAYNRDLVLDNPGQGLDFTLDSAHEVVPVLSGRAYYQETPWMCWRTAFREVLKLRASLPNVENEYRLKQWLVHEDAFEYSHLGAEDAVEYYESVKGDPTELRKSYEWDWLASYAFMKRNLLPDQQ